MTTQAKASDIVFTRHGARRGLAWLVEAYRMFRRAFVPWLLLLAVYYAIMLALARLPFAAHVLVPILKPIFAVGLLAAAWTQERGGKPALSHLFQGFRANLRALVPLGILFVAGITLAVLATSLFDGGRLVDLLARAPQAAAEAGSATQGGTDKAATESVLASGQVQKSLLLAALLAIPTVLAMWFAPALVVFQDAGPATALGASFRAAVANWRPLIVYALAVLLFGALLPLIVAQFVVVLLPSEATVQVVQIAYLGYGLMFAATLHISDYVSYRDVFHAGETLAPLERSRG